MRIGITTFGGDGGKSGDWDRADGVHRAAAVVPCAADIVFTGFTAESDLPDLYRAADLFVFPSLHEGFSWRRTAARTLDALLSTARGRGGVPGH